ncbi:MAG: hypothetical protein HKM06_08690 [Spirochaetales bacterium]|nr:hypothetical protein [Spirochaetales bacterium]
MTMTINGSNVPVTWDKERCLEEILSSLAGWSESQGHRILSVLANGRAAQTLDPGTPPQEIQSLDVETCPASASQEEETRVLLDYLNLLSESAEKGADSSLAELKTEFPWIAPALHRKLLTREPDWEHRDVLAQQAKDWIERIRYPALGLKDLVERLQDWGRLIQRGQDQVAMKVLEDLSDELTLLSHSGLGSAELWQELNGFLQEAANALENRDFVLVADLLEYEIVPRLVSMGT